MRQSDISKLNELASQYDIKIEKTGPSTNNEIKALYRCIKLLVLHEDQPELTDIPNESEIEHWCDRLDEKMSHMKGQLMELHNAKKTASRLGDELKCCYSIFLENSHRYREHLVIFGQPYEKLKKDLDVAEADTYREIERLGSLEEKYQNRDELAELCRLKENLDKREFELDKEIEEKKVRIHEYRSINPELLNEYMSLENEHEMHSLLSQIDISYQSV